MTNPEHDHIGAKCPECGKTASYEATVTWDPFSTSDKGRSKIQLSDAEREALRDIERDVSEQRDQRLNEAMMDSDIAIVIQQVLDTLDSMALDKTEDYDGDLLTPDMRYMTARNRLRQDLDRLQTLLEAEWINGQTTGRINIRRWISAQSPRQQLESFRKYLPDDIDETGIDVVGLIDQSGSMGRMMDHASQVMWAIASAVRLTGNNSAIIGFANNHEVLIGRKQKLPTNMYPPFNCGGGTNPYSAICVAEQMFVESEMPNKLLFVVTDGEWGGLDRCEHKIREIANNYEVDTLLVNLGHDGHSNAKRGCDHVINAHNVDEMCAALSLVITDISKRCAMRIAAETNREM